MNLPVQFSPNAAAFVGGTLADVRSIWNAQGSSVAITGQSANLGVEASSQKAGVLLRSVPQQASFEEKIFNSVVALKVAFAQYAMHLPREERTRLFARLDDVLNVEDWHEEDTLPILESFVYFLKWIIFSKYFGWASIGVSDDGNILVAWTQPHLILTACFFPRNWVTWTASIQSENGPSHSVGSGALQHFAKQAMFYLSGEAAA
jgi:hypothetical protein